MGNQLITPSAWARTLSEFATWLRASNKPESTVYLRLYQLRRFAASSKLDPFAVTLDDLTVYLSMHKWSANTRRAARSGLRSFYRWAHATGRMGHNPGELLPVVPAPLGRPRPASEATVQDGLHLHDERVQLMIRLAATAGLRCCEIAVVHVSDLRPSLEGWSLLAHGKGRRVRVVPISDRLADDITKAAGYLFPGQIDGHLSAAYVSKLVSRALPDGETAHMLRHRYASVAFAAERDIRAVQELLGHASVATTQVYTAVPDGALRRAALAAA